MPAPGFQRISGATQTEVILRASQGQNKKLIAKELGISRPSVYRILERAQFDTVLEDCRNRALQLSPLALDAVEGSMKKGNGMVAIKLLQGTGVLNSDGGQVNVAIQVNGDLPRPTRNTILSADQSIMQSDARND